MIAVAIGFVIAFAAALVAHRYRRLDQPIGLFTDFLYTIPSLALFQLLVPLTGLTVTTVEIALVAYTLLILYRNILEGLRAVPEEVLRGGARDGPDDRCRPSSASSCRSRAPSIVAGLRIATVSTISIATIAAFVIPEGLGRPIFIGITQDIFKTEIIAAGGLTILLALAADALLVAAQRAAHARGARRVIASPTPSSWGTFPDAIRFIGDHPHLLWDKTVEHLALSGAALGIALAIALPLGRGPRPLPPRLVPRDQRLEHRPRAAEPRR